MSERYIRRSNPLAGVEPASSFQEPLEDRLPTSPGADDIYNPQSRAAHFAMVASRIIRRKYGIESGDFRRLAQHDREMLRIHGELMRGEYTPPPMPKPRPVQPLGPMHTGLNSFLLGRG